MREGEIVLVSNWKHTRYLECKVSLPEICHKDLSTLKDLNCSPEGVR